MMRRVSGQVAHRDTVLATELFGASDRPAMVLIMGATASMIGWPDSLCVELARRGFRVVRFDHRDTGRSTTVPPGEAGYAAEDMAADVVAILDGLGLDRAHLVGMSLGGYIGQMIAVDHPARVATLTLIASEPLGWDGDPLPHIAPEFMAHFGALATLDWTDAAAVEDFLVGIDALSCGTGHRFDAAAARAQARLVLSRTASPASMFNHATVATRKEWTGHYRRIAQPTLVIHGQDDPVLPIENGRALAASIAGAHIAELEGVGHELPAAHIADIAALIARHASGGG